MSTTDWKDVTIILANGEKRPAKACYVGDGWCDVIVESDGLTARTRVLADGSASPPMNPCRLAEPFPLTAPPPRTLPVTPAERFCATVLRAWQAWPGRAAGDDPHSPAALAATAMHDALYQARLISPGDLTPAGRELLARVEAEERTPATVLRATLNRLRDAINNPPDGDDNDWKSAMRAALREHEAALAGTVPLDAPPRREP